MSNASESSKNAAASSQNGSVLQRPANPGPASQMWPTPSSPPTTTVAMQNHRRMVYHQLQSQLISPEDQEKLLCEWFVKVPDAKEQAAVERTRAFFGKDPYSAPYHSYYISGEVNDDYIRFVIRSGLRRGRISQQDLREFITERMVPFEESGLRFSLVLIRIKSYLCLERRIPFLFTIRGTGGTDPGPRGARIVAQVTTDGLVDFTELKSGKSVEGTVEAEEAEPQNTSLQEVLKSYYTNYSLYRKEVGQSHVNSVLSKEKSHEDDGRSPVSGEPSEEKPDEGDGDKSPVSGETLDENGGEGGVHISPMDDESSEAVDEDDGHVSDDSDQTTAPTSCGSETGESDYQERRRIIGELYKAVAEQSKRRARKELEHMCLKISLCDKMADLKSLAKRMSETEDQMDQHERKIEDKKFTNPEDQQTLHTHTGRRKSTV
ncbi:hypothetical protein J7337_005143 [Fusarium musae]|uniref:Uncharacterized protein n=1 Tax=Fusarium musae TaxID=1042133 RepID=A0A9P8DI58_9HYPO|nr:hypothetical protein J7337_005143 [Fusarium musae]KAG9502316.1 hypothetical protein J7337_005143 [Fusarium musae]